MFCKTIILSNSENLTNNAPKGILTLSKENKIIKGKIRLYNITSLPQSTKIGLYINEKVYTSPLNRKPNHYEFDLDENIDITQSVYCALIDTSNNKKVLLEGGSFNGFYFTDSPFDAVLEAKDEQLEQTIDTAIKSIENCEHCNCADCEYKKYFYDNYKVDNTQSPNCDNKQELYEHNNCKNTDTYFNPSIKTNVPQHHFVDNIQSNIVDKLKTECIDDIDNYIKYFDHESMVNTHNTDTVQPLNSEDTHFQPDIQESNNKTSQEKLDFLNDIIYQLDEMFERYPEDEILNSIIENSRFIRVDGDNPYVLGVIYEDKMLKYIAYGVPAKYNSLPPIDLGQNYQWLPINPRDVMSDGYFMIYQDAVTGSIVEISFEE